MKSRVIISLILIGILLCMINLNAYEKALPEVGYHNTKDMGSDFDIISKGDKKIEVKEPYTALFINGTFIMDYEVIIKNNRSFVPVRLISESLDSKVVWDDKKKSVEITKDKKQIILTIGSKKASVNNKVVTLDSEAIIYKSLTYVPLRFIAENLDAKVVYTTKYNPDTNSKDRIYDYLLKQYYVLPQVNSFLEQCANIIIDEKYDFKSTISKIDAEKYLKEKLKIGINIQKTSHISSIKEALFGEDKNVIESSIRFTENEYDALLKNIDNMSYVGELSRYYKFTIGYYDVLIDRFNKNIYLMINYNGTYIIKFDENKGLFSAGYFVG